jgi:hypothetical protein
MFVPARGKPPAVPEGYIRDPGNPYMMRPKPTVTNQEATDRELYQHLYEDRMLNYGSAAHNRCPGVKFFADYEYYLEGPVFDWGCGRGDTVALLREHGHYATGMDQIDLDNEMLVGDITQPQIVMHEGSSHSVPYKTALCIDVFEHLADEDLEGLIANMLTSEKQIISVHTGTAYEPGCKKNLHINRKSFVDWHAFLESQGLEIVRFLQLGKRRGIYFCTGR